jgi:methyltransferase family protein
VPVPQPFAARDYSDTRRRAKSGAVRVLSTMLRPLDIDIELQHFYSPIPRRGELPDEFWDRKSELAGIDWDLDRQLANVAELQPALAEFRPPHGPTGRRHEFFIDNGLYQATDADLLHAMIRHHRPDLVIELGAGFSTLVSAGATEANRADGAATRLESYDPYAIPPSKDELPGLDVLKPVAAQDIPLEDFARLHDGDILFVDTSHTVKIGGDTTHIVLEVLPRLAPGVIVHFHDVFLPWHYPRDWIEHNRWYWAEQYLLQAFLAGNPDWEVLIGAYALSRERADELRRLVTNVDPAHPPLSLWLRRRPR